MASYLKYGIVVAVVATIYLIGYKHAENEGLLAIEELKNAHAQAIIDAQVAEKRKYEAQIKDLVARLDALNVEHSSRMREFESFRSRTTDYGTCIRQRSDLAELAVEGENLLNEASIYLSGGSK